MDEKEIEIRELKKLIQNNLQESGLLKKEIAGEVYDDY